MIEPDTIGLLILDVARMQRSEFEKRIVRDGLIVTPGEARALIHIWKSAGGRQNEIADRMCVEPMTMSGYIDKLEGLGLVERQPDPCDRRARNITLTVKAEPLLEQLLTLANDLGEELLQGVPQEQAQAGERMLKIIRHNLLKITSSRELA
jgi:MarR family transcriptional regulator, transcriptional regulator for hemolysin